ncbi:MAG: hypothetical protein J6A60_01380 [Clostridia bacterium]|nr:hypothetical protein [Clostridia bacterium]
MNYSFGNRKKQIEQFPKKKPQRGYEKEDEILSDVQGSYTGVPFDKNEKPVQDADDL